MKQTSDLNKLKGKWITDKATTFPHNNCPEGDYCHIYIIKVSRAIVKVNEKENGSMKSENVKNKKELFTQEKGKIYLSKDEMENFAFSEKRHRENEELYNIIKALVTMPWIIIKKVTFKSTRDRQAQEIERLKRVIESKDRARENITMQGLPLRWDDSYLVEDGIFSIGRYYDSNWNCFSKDLSMANFNTYANILVGGMPGGGKTKLMQLLAYQALRHGSTVYIGDFKRLDFMKFKSKCNVVIST